MPSDNRWPSDLMALLEEHGAVADFNRLVSDGCAPDQLALRIQMLTLDTSETETIEFFFGKDRKKIRRDLLRIERCAELIKSLNSIYFGAVLGTTVRELLKTPELLELYAIFMRGFIKSRGPKQNIGANLRMMHLVAYVEQCTGSPHDAEVAAVAGAVQGKEYSAEAAKAFRLDHGKLAEFFRDPGSLPPPRRPRRRRTPTKAPRRSK